MSRGKFIAIATAAFGLAAPFMAAPVAAQESEVLFQHKHWKVEVVAWDDGTLGCVAQVGNGTDSFSLWTFADGAVQMQFYSTSWSFGEGETGDLQVQIDKRPKWELTDAELYKNSVLFNLPDSDAGVNFIVEVAKGSRLYLRSKEGKGVKDYSLSGSRASIDALLKCGEIVAESTGGKSSSTNPFQ